MPSTEYRIINEYGTIDRFYTLREFESMKSVYDTHKLKYTTEIIELYS